MGDADIDTFYAHIQSDDLCDRTSRGLAVYLHRKPGTWLKGKSFDHRLFRRKYARKVVRTVVFLFFYMETPVK